MEKTISNNPLNVFLILLITGIIICAYMPTFALAGNVSYQYDPAGRLTRIDYGNGQSISFIYDKAGNLLNKIVKKSNILLLVVPAISGAVNN